MPLLNTYLAAVIAGAMPLAPMTGDINVMIIVAVILIAAFLIFILLKGNRRGR